MGKLFVASVAVVLIALGPSFIGGDKSGALSEWQMYACFPAGILAAISLVAMASSKPQQRILSEAEQNALTPAEYEQRGRSNEPVYYTSDGRLDTPQYDSDNGLFANHQWQSGGRSLTDDDRKHIPQPDAGGLTIINGVAYTGKEIDGMTWGKGHNGGQNHNTKQHDGFEAWYDKEHGRPFNHQGTNLTDQDYQWLRHSSYGKPEMSDSEWKRFHQIENDYGDSIFDQMQTLGPIDDDHLFEHWEAPDNIDPKTGKNINDWEGD